MAMFATVTIKRMVVEDAMLRRGWYQGELAQKAGMSAATLSRAMREIPVSVGTARDIANALNISLKSMLEETYSKGAALSVALNERGPFERALAEADEKPFFGKMLRGED
ncbi:MAG TPA: helix-turn-helix transcriptional regulator [Phycisphaerae bacterium]|nr:helix-turn-helix transcriptional regulator [Phycisphaerae bacterium]